MKTIIAAIMATLISVQAYSQQIIQGKVVEATSKKEEIAFANIYWLQSQKGTSSNEKGEFKIEQKKEDGNILIVSYVGYQNDTVKITANQPPLTIALTSSIELSGAEVKSNLGGTYVSRLNSLKTEVITAEGLCKLACCNLAESFENSATVDVGYSDAVSGARQIQMLGLSGIYSQMMYENMPFLKGLSAPFGLGFVPGSFMDGIQISKGTASVLNGFEAITGQINLEYRKPETADPLFLNLFLNSELKGEINAIGNIKINEKVGTTVLAHGSYFNRELDHVGEGGGHDGFMDSPKTRQYNVINRWRYAGKRYRNITTLSMVNETRNGGQVGFNPSTDRKDTNKYGIGIYTQRYQLFTKNGFTLNEKENIGTQASVTWFDQNSFYGQNEYIGQEGNIYANIIYENLISEEHKFSGGASLQYNSYNESFKDIVQKKSETIPGVFAQYSYTLGETLSVIGGLRYDYNTFFEKNMITPRLHLRWNIDDHFTFRASGGRGYRTPNFLSENVGLMASSRAFILNEEIEMEEAWNYGTNLVYNIPLDNNRKISFALDAYRTDFVNQLVVDLDASANEVRFYNLKGESYSNSLQLEMNADLFTGFNLILAGRYNDVQITIDNKLREKPYVNQWKGLAVLSYATKFQKWMFDFTFQVNGDTRLPNTNGARPERSEPYIMMFAQITKRFKNIDIYAGCENVGNYTQKDPIINPRNPYSSNFDASVVWGPLMPRMFYGGIRLTINEI